MFPHLHGQSNIHFRNKMFLKKFRNTFCFLETKNVSGTYVTCVRKQGNIQSNNGSLFAVPLQWIILEFRAILGLGSTV